MVDVIDVHRDVYGVEPICTELPIAPSPYYEHKARQVDPSRVPARTQRDEALDVEIRCLWDENFQVYGARKVWRQLQRESFEVARCTVERLMHRGGISAAPCGADSAVRRNQRPLEPVLKTRYGASSPPSAQPAVDR